MHSFHHSRSRILFEVFCALAISASCVSAWMQTGAQALLPAAAVAATLRHCPCVRSGRAQLAPAVGQPESEGAKDRSGRLCRRSAGGREPAAGNGQRRRGSGTASNQQLPRQADAPKPKPRGKATVAGPALPTRRRSPSSRPRLRPKSPCRCLPRRWLTCTSSRCSNRNHSSGCRARHLAVRPASRQHGHRQLIGLSYRPIAVSWWPTPDSGSPAVGRTREFERARP